MQDFQIAVIDIANQLSQRRLDLPWMDNNLLCAFLLRFQKSLNVVDLVSCGEISFFYGMLNLIIIKHFKIAKTGGDQNIEGRQLNV